MRDPLRDLPIRLWEMLEDVINAANTATENLPNVVLSYFRQAQLDDEKVPQKFRYLFIGFRSFLSRHYFPLASRMLPDNIIQDFHFGFPADR
jgi:hypothetical protein